MAPDLQKITMQYMEEHQIQEIFEVSSRLWILAVCPAPAWGTEGNPSNLGPLRKQIPVGGLVSGLADEWLCIPDTIRFLSHLRSVCRS